MGMENHPSWRTPSFFRGVGWNHQPVMVSSGFLKKRDALKERNMMLEDANDFLCAVGEDWRFRLSMAKGTVSSIGYHMLLPRFILRILGMFKLEFELSANAESCEDALRNSVHTINETSINKWINYSLDKALFFSTVIGHPHTPKIAGGGTNHFKNGSSHPENSQEFRKTISRNSNIFLLTSFQYVLFFFLISKWIPIDSIDPTPSFSSVVWYYRPSAGPIRTRFPLHLLLLHGLLVARRDGMMGSTWDPITSMEFSGSNTWRYVFTYHFSGHMNGGDRPTIYGRYLQ